ncbi:MAG: response regulator [Oligoflexia bacterium]|nr:response regulator [Oligoflexia bacterium]
MLEQDQQNGKIILVVEDNEANKKLLRLMLQRVGHEVDTVSSGKEALTALEKKRYDLVFMDVTMPEMDGFETTKQIRNSQTIQNKNLPVLAITGHTSDEYKNKCFESGMNDYIEKPYLLDDLQKVITKVFKN